MCLYSKQKRLKIAKKDIVCYKAFEATNDNSIVTPVLKIKPSIEELEGKKPFKAVGRTGKYKLFSGFFLDDMYEYGRGLIHTYIDKKHIPTNPTFVIYKCRIPKFTRYVTGGGEIAAKKIIIDEIVWDGRVWNGF